MALPPINPIKHDGRDISYFEMLSILARKILQAEGMELNFEGFNETILDYQHMELDDIEIAWRLSKELNAWSEYLSAMSNLVQKILLDSETEESERQAISSIKYDSEKVSNGNRMSFQDADVLSVKKKRNILKSFYDELGDKIKFLERAHYHCKSTYDAYQKSSFPVFPGRS